jgi:hypothetical protein
MLIAAGFKNPTISRVSTLGLARFLIVLSANMSSPTAVTITTDTPSLEAKTAHAGTPQFEVRRLCR